MIINMIIYIYYIKYIYIYIYQSIYLYIYSLPETISQTASIWNKHNVCLHIILK